MGQLYNRGSLFPRDNEKAHDWMVLAAEQGHPRAQEFLAVMYHDGIEVKRDYGKALEWYRKSVASGNASAQFSLAEMYFKGEGTDPDYLQAYVLASLAATVDWPKAAKLRGKAAKKLTSEELATAEQLIAAAGGG
jgi:hypothetical protein